MSFEPLNVGFQPAAGELGGNGARGEWRFGVAPSRRDGVLPDDCAVPP